MSNMSLRTKGLILIVLISFIPLLLAGWGNYSTAKDAMMRSEMEKISSKLSSQASNISAWMDIRRAEVLVMSRTSALRYGTNAERLNYFQRELVRSGFTYHAIGFIGQDGIAYRSDGASRDMKGEPFFEPAINGAITITDPYKPVFSVVEQTFIAVPVYGVGTQIEGVIYASIPFTAFNRFFDFADENAPVRFYNDEGEIIYGSAPGVARMSSLRSDSTLSEVAHEILSHNEGKVNIQVDGEAYVVFYAKVAGTPWRIALQERYSHMKEMLTPIFWRIVSTIAVAEVFIALSFYLYFNQIIKRLERILSVTKQAAAGEFQAEHLDTSQYDEIGKLAHSVNGMMEHLQEMFDRLNAIINQNQYGFIVLDNEYKVAYLNKTAEEMLGYTTQELAGHATPLLFMDNEEIAVEAERLTEQLGRHIQPGLEVFRELRDDRFSYEREWTFIHKDGHRIPILHSSNGLRDRNGKFSGVVGMLRDISDRKQVEKARNRLLDIVESAKDLIASVDMNGELIYMNRAGKEMLGLPGEEKDASTVKDHIDPRMYEQILQGAELAREYGYWESNTQLQKSNGEPLFVSMVVVTHVDASTGEPFFSCIARDISEQKLVQEELVRATLEAEEANQAKSRFLALMSHEIRTPLNGIIGLTQLLRKTELSIVQKDYLDKMSMSSETLHRMISDVLDFSKIEADKIEMERLPFQPEELLHRLANGLSVFLGGKEQFEFMIKTPDELPQTLIGDSLRLEQVLLNLCVNAIKFTEKGLVKLELDIVEQHADAVKLRFLIADSGIGMSKSVMDKLFKPFTQADSSTTRKYGGTGLGLVISKSLVEMMGGELHVSSKEGVGSRFAFALSFQVNPYRHELDVAAAAPVPEGTVWIVEDDSKMRDHWTYLFESLGWSAISYNSWQNTRERLRRVGEGVLPDLLLMDMEMPDMYGIETWRLFRSEAEAAGVPIIALTTTYGRDELQQLKEEERPVAILTKPVTRGAIVRSLNEALRSRLAVRQYTMREEHADRPYAHSQSNAQRVLLAEDNKINQLVAIELLKENGYEVGLAETGEEVLRLLEAGSWDIIMMDIHMPVMDGTEAVRIIRSQERYKHIPIIAVTANAVKKDHDRYIRLGMNDVMTKPLSGDRLREIMKYWLEKAASLPKAQYVLGDGSSSYAGINRGSSPGSHALAPIAGMDVDSALERVNGKQQILFHMIEQFRLDYDSFMDQLRMMLKQSETQTALRMLHTLKGAAGYLSARELGDAAHEASEAIKRGEQPKELALVLAHLEKELVQLLAGLHEAVNRFDN
ncbi:response regulator [Paenibacillus sp. 1011MAR3C5]|uniref:response regulator n=1 Tax=Paenibacillus sp. 1011MAR3C5 TaxID=1675787 RepID=UPI000E6C1E74|nr:response regulator [Paenibacillus sp. 1011MAR3C5]RJE84297.1 response regulator [Paenibacillus sp. 1011MAR3C5]